MLKIITVLVTTFLFAGLLIAHPYTSPVDPAGPTVKIATAAVAQAEPSQSVAVAEPGPVPSQTIAQQDARVVGPSGGNADTSAVAARPQVEQPGLQLPRPPQGNRYVAANAGITGQQTSAPVATHPQPAAPTFGPVAGYGPATAYGNLSTPPRQDGRHRSQQADATPSRIDPPAATPGLRVVYNRPMPLEQRIHLEHTNRYSRQ